MIISNKNFFIPDLSEWTTSLTHINQSVSGCLLLWFLFTYWWFFLCGYFLVRNVFLKKIVSLRNAIYFGWYFRKISSQNGHSFMIWEHIILLLESTHYQITAPVDVSSITAQGTKASSSRSTMPRIFAEISNSTFSAKSILLYPC